MHGRKTRKSQVRRDGRGDGATEERERSAGHVVEDGGRDRCRRRSCRGEGRGRNCNTVTVCIHTTSVRTRGQIRTQSVEEREGDCRDR